MTTELDKFTQAKVMAHKLGYVIRKADNPDPLNPNDLDQYNVQTRMTRWLILRSSLRALLKESRSQGAVN
jgi:hypothetical protein